MHLGQHPPTQTPDRAVVPFDQAGKRDLVASGDEALEQLLIAQAGSD
jgi:hypothetical protein